MESYKDGKLFVNGIEVIGFAEESCTLDARDKLVRNMLVSDIADKMATLILTDFGATKIPLTSTGTGMNMVKHAIINYANEIAQAIFNQQEASKRG